MPNPDSFKTFFKMSSSSFEWLSGLLEPLLDCRDPIGSPLNLSAELRLGIGLLRLATGSDYSEIATRFGVTESATRFCARQLCRVLCTNFRFWVAFPNSSELGSVSEGFESLTGLPNCCGVMNCTRFKFVRKLDSETLHSDSIGVQIVGVIGLKNTITGDTLTYGNDFIVLEKMSFPEPVLQVAVEPVFA
ncbi:MAG: hypothetical protein Q8881_03365, partial [Sweet potato little leaf phytoplasma]|nr:hypothetical protein [Sweet potato little leaf phytoplasma]